MHACQVMLSMRFVHARLGICTVLHRVPQPHHDIVAPLGSAAQFVLEQTPYLQKYTMNWILVLSTLNPPETDQRTTHCLLVQYAAPEISPFSGADSYLHPSRLAGAHALKSARTAPPHQLIETKIVRKSSRLQVSMVQSLYKRAAALYWNLKLWCRLRSLPLTASLCRCAATNC